MSSIPNMPLKNPVSVLHELADQKLISLPEYILTEESQKIFKCVLKIGDVTISKVSTSKKLAKYFCASDFLKIVQLPTDLKNTPQTVDVETPSASRAVGKLNELCIQRKEPMPVYEVEQNSEGFVVKCKCLSYITEGKSKSKKLARQIAATNMLSKEEFVKLTKYSPGIEGKLLEVFEDLEINEASSKKEAIKSVKELPTKEENEYLECKIKHLGYEYAVITVQEAPLILSLRGTNLTTSEVQTFVKCCDSYEGGVSELLQKAAAMLPVLGL